MDRPLDRRMTDVAVDRRRWPRETRMTHRRSGAALVALVLLAIASCSGRSQPNPDVIDELGGRLVGAVPIDGTAWLVVRSSADDDRGSYLLSLDPASGAILERSRLTEGGVHEGLAAWDGSLYVRYGEPIDSVPLEELAFDSILPYEVLLEIDPSTRTIVRQFEVPGLMMRWEPMTVLDGRYWQHAAWNGYVDLRTAEASFVPTLATVRTAHHDDDFVWTVGPKQVIQVDRRSGAIVEQFRYADHHDDDVPFSGQFKFHDEKYWIVGNDFGDFDNAYEYDLATGAYSSPVARSELPTASFESGGNRWELYNEDWYGRPLEPAEPGDVWRRVDLATNETIAEYEFGAYRPRFVADGFLWLTRTADDTGGDELARVPLESG